MTRLLLVKYEADSHYAYIIHDVGDPYGEPWLDRFKKAIVLYAEERSLKPAWDLGWMVGSDHLMDLGIELEYIGDPLTVNHEDVLSIDMEVPF